MSDRHPAGGPPASRTRWDVDENEQTSTDRTLDARLGAVVRELRRPVGVDAALDRRVMQAVAAGPHPVRGAGAAVDDPAAVRAWRWLRRPRTVRVSPLGGLAGLVTLAAAAALLLAVRPPEAGAPAAVAAAPAAAVGATGPAAATGPADGIQLVRFVLVAPTAHAVAVVGDFNDWQVGATPLRPAASGRMWTVDVPLAPGRHRYAFVVDGESWLPDPTAPRASGADFGTPSSVVTVAESRS